MVRSETDGACRHPDLEQPRIGVDERGAAEPLHDRGGRRVPQIEEQIGASGGVEVQRALGDVLRDRGSVHRVERQRVSQAVGLQARLEGRDAVDSTATAPAAAAGR